MRGALRFMPGYSAVARALTGLPPLAPGHGAQKSVVVAPTVRDESELRDIVAKARFFLSGFGVERVWVPVTRELRGVRANHPIGTPDYAVEARGPGSPDMRVGSPTRVRTLREHLGCDYIFVWDERWLDSTPARLLSSKIIQVDRHRQQWDGWAWASFATRLQTPREKQQQAREAQQRFLSFVETLPSFSRSYVFGTGPSLDLAAARDFRDGYRIVCNTIVRNAALLDHIAPHFIVAADAIYHYGNSRHAAAFRDDLRTFLRRSETRLLIPDSFYALFLRDSPDLAEKTIPVDTSESGIFLDLKRRLQYTSMPNVLNGVLLPLGSSLADEIVLIGFDGRAPGATQFWSNSSANSYPELKATIEAAHPAFFAKMNYESYARDQSDGAERVMSEGERLGKRYVCVHGTHIPALRSRMVNAPAPA